MCVISLPLIIPYDRPDDEDESVGPVQLRDPLLQPVSWEIIETLNSRSTVIGSPWGQYYLLQFETDNAWEKSYRISQAVKSLEDAAEVVRESRRNRDEVEGKVILPPGSFGFGSLQSSQQTQSQIQSQQSGFQPGPQLQPGGFTFGASAIFGSFGTGNTGASSQVSLFGSGQSAKSTREAIVEIYALKEAFYPSTPTVDRTLLRDWFVNGIDHLENACIATTDKPEILRNLLLAISKPGFEVVLSIKLSNNRNPSIQRVSCACAYAIKILHRQGPEFFQFVLRHAPYSVLLETVLVDRGALIAEEMEHQVLQAAAVVFTTPEPQYAKEVTYARAVAIMVARIVDRFYKEENTFLTKDEGERARRLEQRISALIKKVFENRNNNDNKPRAAITAAAAICALILAGALTFADSLEHRREKNQARAELAVSAILSCIGFAVPIPYFAAASGLATVLGTLIVRHIWKSNKDPGLKSVLVIQTLQTVLWPLVRRREVLPVGLVGLTFEEASEFKMFFELVLQSAWMRY